MASTIEATSLILRSGVYIILASPKGNVPAITSREAKIHVDYVKRVVRVTPHRITGRVVASVLPFEACASWVEAPPKPAKRTKSPIGSLQPTES